MIFNAGLALFPAIGGLIVGALGILRGLGIKRSAPMSLELFTAAGLLTLSQDSSWQAIASAAAIIAVRKLVMKSLSS
ncbi:MAG: hypothetical protein NTY08_11700 [Proteobacteria bacterium]|nr:hypothetical protein [Pseudomonadota bacterium]